MKPKYSVSDVERLFNMCCKYISIDFKFNCLTDGPARIENSIQYYNIEKYELDTWWNKMLIFHNDYSSNGINIFFDLDISIEKNIDCLINMIDDDKISVVDTPWKNAKYFAQNSKNKDAFLAYGNTSVIGWIGKKHHILFERFYDNIFEVTSKHFGDDTYINQYENKRYFDTIIDSFKMNKVNDPHIIVNYKKLIS